VLTRETEITLSGMRFHAYVGVLPHERELRQPVEVDLTVWAAAAARAEGVVDYRALYDLAAAVFAAGHVGYLEEAAERVAAAALAVERVVGVRVAVRKPHVALPGPLAFAQVVVERGRRAAAAGAA
jgi:dihydroneopterin aldolase